MSQRKYKNLSTPLYVKLRFKKIPLLELTKITSTPLKIGPVADELSHKYLYLFFDELITLSKHNLNFLLTEYFFNKRQSRGGQFL